MKVTYDKQVDVMTIEFSRERIHDSDEIGPGVIVGYSESGDLIHIEILDAAKRGDGADRVEYVISGTGGDTEAARPGPRG